MADVVALIDSGKNIQNGGSYIAAGPRVQEGDPNRVLEDRIVEGNATYIENQYTSRLAVD